LKGLPAFILSYMNGNEHAWYFSFFPWAAFTFAGITFGYLLLEGKERIGEREFFKRVSAAGVVAYAAGAGMSLTGFFEYGFFDYSLTSPHFFLVRLGWILLILYGAYLWSTREAAGKWTPLVSLGQASLIVYWLHIEIVYGRLFRGFGQSLELSTAAMQLIWLLPLMLMAASPRRIAQRATAFLPRVQLLLERRNVSDWLLAREIFADVGRGPAVDHRTIAE
jgi:fucose 4-O-acetylase-like acetyltransferase